MSIEVPGSGIESPEDKYKRLLLASIETSKKYEKLSKTKAEESVSDLVQQMEDEMQERVVLLRQMGATNIESVFPGAKRSEEAEEANQQLNKLQQEIVKINIERVSDPGFDMKELDQMTNRAKDLLAKSEIPELSEQETKQFEEALKKLARDSGYEIEGEIHGNWITLTRGDLKFRIKQFRFPNNKSIGGYSRISKMEVYQNTKDDTGERLFSYLRDFNIVNQNFGVQEEIDRVVAIFG